MEPETEASASKRRAPKLPVRKSATSVNRPNEQQPSMSKAGVRPRFLCFSRPCLTLALSCFTRTGFAIWLYEFGRKTFVHN